jgi:hypothetical protein
VESVGLGGLCGFPQLFAIVIEITIQVSSSLRLLLGKSYSCWNRNLHALVHKWRQAFETSSTTGTSTVLCYMFAAAEAWVDQPPLVALAPNCCDCESLARLSACEFMASTWVVSLVSVVHMTRVLERCISEHHLPSVVDVSKVNWSM